MDVSLWMADVIIRDIREMQVNAWLDWQVIDASAAWRSIEVNQSRQTFAPNKRFFMHGNFSRFIRPGSKILATGAGNILAALVPETGNLVVVILNPDNAAKSYSLDLSKFPQAASGAVYSTSATDDLRRLEDVPVLERRMAAAVAAKSVVTFVVRVAAPASLASRAGKEYLIGPRRVHSAIGLKTSGYGILFHPGAGQAEFDARGRMSERRLPLP